MNIALPFVGLFTAIYLTIASIWPRFSLAMLLFLLPVYQIRFVVFGIPGTLLEVMIVVFVIMACVKERDQLGKMMRAEITALRAQGVRWLLTPIGVLKVLSVWLFLASLISLTITPTVIAGLGIWKAYIIEPMAFAFALLLYMRSGKWQVSLTVIRALAASALIVGLWAMVQYVGGWGIPEAWQPWDLRRAVSVFDYPNAVGLYLAPIVSMAIATLLHGRSLWEDVATHAKSRNQSIPLSDRTLLLLAALAGTGGVLAARADGAVVAIAAAVFVMLLFTRVRFMAIAAGVLVLGIAFAFPPTRDILLFQDVSGDVRLALWTGTWNLLSHQPLTGAGLAAFPVVYNEYRLDSHVELLQYPHNIFFDFWVELGLLGVLWIVAVCVFGVWVSIVQHAAKQKASLILLAVYTSIFVYGLVDVPYFKNDLAILVWTAIAFSIALYAQRWERSVQHS